MAIAISSVTSGTDTGLSATVSVTTSESPVTTKVGDLVVVVYANDFYALSNMGTPSATGTPTMNAITGATGDGGSNEAHIKAWWYVVNTAGAQTISATETGTHDEEKSITAYVLTGADTTTPVDAAAGNTSTTTITTSQVAPAVSPTTTNAFLVCQITAGGGAASASYTTPSPLTEQFEIHAGSISGVGATNQLSASGSTGTFTFTASASTAYSSCSIAIKTATATAAVFPPPNIRSRRPVPYRVARTRQTVPVRAQVNPPHPTREIVQPRRIRGLLPRRGRSVVPVPPQFNPPFPVAELAQPRRLRGILLRRTKLAAVVPPQVNPPYLFLAVVQPRRLRGMPVRRGHAWSPPWPSLTAPPNPALPLRPSRRMTVLPALVRRSHLPVPPQAAPPSLTLVRRPARPAPTRRARQGNPPWAAALCPAATAGRRPRPPAVRRSRTINALPTPLVIAPAWPVAMPPARRPVPLAIHRAHVTGVVAPGAAPAPPPVGETSGAAVPYPGTDTGPVWLAGQEESGAVSAGASASFAVSAGIQ